MDALAAGRALGNSRDFCFSFSVSSEHPRQHHVAVTTGRPQFPTGGLDLSALGQIEIQDLSPQILDAVAFA